jgi:hypothetical protein
LKQSDYGGVLEPVHVSLLYRKERGMTLDYLMFLKEKYTGRVKGRALFLTCVIDAMEHRHVATADIPRAIMHADIDELVHIQFEGTLAKLLSQINPQLYHKFVYQEKGKPVLYAKLAETLYGTLCAALPFWKNLTQALVEWEFVVNRYKTCMANKNINGMQCTVAWRVDNSRIFHVKEQVILQIIKLLNDKHGKLSPLSYTIGKKHQYLAMLIEFGYMCIDMREYITRILEEVPIVMRGRATTPDYLFNTNEACMKLTEKKETRFFHYMVAKLWFLSKKGEISYPNSYSVS